MWLCFCMSVLSSGCFVFGHFDNRKWHPVFFIFISLIKIKAVPCFMVLIAHWPSLFMFCELSVYKWKCSIISVLDQMTSWDHAVLVIFCFCCIANWSLSTGFFSFAPKQTSYMVCKKKNREASVTGAVWVKREETGDEVREIMCLLGLWRKKS